MCEQVQNPVRRLGLQLLVLKAGTEPSWRPRLPRIRKGRPTALIVANDPLYIGWREKIATLAARSRRAHDPAGTRIRCRGRIDELRRKPAGPFRQVGLYVGRVLKGAKPADLPVLQPVKLDLVINLKTAKTLGLEIPSKLLFTADEVIE